MNYIKELLEKNTTYKPVLILKNGSKALGLGIKGSDNDFMVFCEPSVDNLISGIFVADNLSLYDENGNEFEYKLKDIRDLPTLIRSFNYETLIGILNEPLYVDYKYKELVDYIYKNKTTYFCSNPYKFLSRLSGLSILRCRSYSKNLDNKHLMYIKLYYYWYKKLYKNDNFKKGDISLNIPLKMTEELLEFRKGKVTEEDVEEILSYMSEIVENNKRNSSKYKAMVNEEPYNKLKDKTNELLKGFIYYKN